MKLLILGFDGFGYNFLRENLEVAPFYRQIMDSGVYGAIRSAYRSTDPSWTSIYTGVTVDKHGIEAGMWTGERVAEEPFPFKRPYKYYWNILGEKMRVGVFSMPLTYPPTRVNGWMVSGFPSPAIPNERLCFTYPARYNDLLENYFESINRWTILANCDLCSLSWDGYLNNLEMVQENKLHNLRRIFGYDPVDCLSVGFQFLDHVLHGLFADTRWVEWVPDEDPKFKERQKQLCRLTNDLTEKLVSEYDPERLLICADHGWAHSEDACLFVYGSDIRNGKLSEGLNEWDVCPIILKLAESEIPEYMNKAVPIFEGEMTTEEREGILKQLRKLGYI